MAAGAPASARDPLRLLRVEHGVDQAIVESRTGGEAAAGLRGAVAFPMTGPSGPLAVVEVFSGAAEEPDEDLIRTLVSVGRRSGEFIERRRAEEAVRESEARKRAVLDAALDCVITIDRPG